MEHGGDPETDARRTGIAAADWLDLSTGINPWPYAPGPIPEAVLARLPARAELVGLEAAARAAYGVPAPAGVVAAPGTQSLIQILPRLRSRAGVAVVGPTYGEHAACWRAAGHAVRETDRLEPDGAEVVVVVNPNNPDGRRHEPTELLEVAGRLAGRGGLLVVDEAFADTDPALSVAPEAGAPGLVVLRSFGKFYGLAGLRLGFALAEPALTARLAKALGPWAVPGPAIWAGTQALRDAAWAEATRARLEREARVLDLALERHGLPVVGGTALFRLARHADAFRLHEALARRGIWVRRFDHAPEWLRFGLPGGEPACGRLDEALAAALLEAPRSHAVSR